MSLWVLIVLLGVLKALMGGLMLWIPYRNERAAASATAAKDAGDAEESGASEDEGGSKALPASPLDPRPRSPRPRPSPRRRGPHGSDPAPPAPARVRTPAIGQAQRAGQRLRLR
jgi:hypothetical protein